MINTFKKKVEEFREDSSRENLVEILKALDKICEAGLKIITPIETPEIAVDEVLPEDVTLQRISDGRSAYLVGYTSMEELKMGPESAAYYTDLDTLMNTAVEADGISGIVIDPWSSSFIFREDLIRTLYEIQDQKKVSVHDVSDNFYVHVLDPKPIDLIISIREKMPQIPEVKKVYLAGLNNDGKESYLLIVDSEGMEMSKLFAEILEVLPVPSNGMRIDITPYTGEVPTADLVYEKVL